MNAAVFVLLGMMLAGCGEDQPLAITAPPALSSMMMMDECGPSWNDCVPASGNDIDDMENALSMYVIKTDQRCIDAHAAIEGFLDTGQHVYKFGSHDGDDGSDIVVGGVYEYELGSFSLGVRDSHWNGAGLLERWKTLIHEGAHMAGMGDTDAYWVEDNCNGGSGSGH